VKQMANENRPRVPISADWVLKRIQEGKRVRLRNAVIEGDIDLNKLDLPTGRIDQTEFQKKMGLAEDVKIIQSSIKITHSTIKGRLNFRNSYFKKVARFDRATFSEDAVFSEATFNDYARFDGATFNDYAGFNEATFNDYAGFSGATFNSFARFDGATFNSFAGFSGATFNGYAGFSGAKFEGEVLTFRGTTFILAQSQEEACRKAKNILEKNGNREEAGYHFYREMDAKRKRKPWYIRYPEYVFVQLIFGYGVHPFRLMFCWFLVAVIFALFYSVKGGVIGKLPASSLPQPWSYLVECFYFSVVTAVTPGYGKYELTSWAYQVGASIEAIFGTFMWAAFIATFARKYMR